jgi:hypothetical protein
MKLMLPYVDETVGSVLSRSARQLCLPVERLVRALTGRRVLEHPQLVANYPDIGAAFEMTRDEFLRRHTTLPYALAFVPTASQVWQSLLSGARDRQACRTASRSALACQEYLRYCPACIEDDLIRYGETYWHRSHQLPAVTICVEHRRQLVASAVRVQSALPVVPPHELPQGVPDPSWLPTSVGWGIARWSFDALCGRLDASASWSAWYLELAARCGYMHPRRGVTSSLLTHDLQRFYGTAFLAGAGCSCEPEHAWAWPGQLLHPRVRSVATPLKYILLAVFLEACPTPSCRLVDWRLRHQTTRAAVAAARPASSVMNRQAGAPVMGSSKPYTAS